MLAAAHAATASESVANATKPSKRLAAKLIQNTASTAPPSTEQVASAATAARSAGSADDIAVTSRHAAASPVAAATTPAAANAPAALGSEAARAIPTAAMPSSTGTATASRAGSARRRASSPSAASTTTSAAAAQAAVRPSSAEPMVRSLSCSATTVAATEPSPAKPTPAKPVPDTRAPAVRAARPSEAPTESICAGGAASPATLRSRDSSKPPTPGSSTKASARPSSAVATAMPVSTARHGHSGPLSTPAARPAATAAPKTAAPRQRASARTRASGGTTSTSSARCRVWPYPSRMPRPTTSTASSVREETWAATAARMAALTTTPTRTLSRVPPRDARTASSEPRPTASAPAISTTASSPVLAGRSAATTPTQQDRGDDPGLLGEGDPRDRGDPPAPAVAGSTAVRGDLLLARHTHRDAGCVRDVRVERSGHVAASGSGATSVAYV